MHTCDDCTNSYFVPGQNQPLVISGGCPECGGNLRPEPDQPTPVRSDGDYRDNFAQDGSSSHNPEGEGILENRSKKDNSFPSMMSSNSGSPVPVKNDMTLNASNQSPQMPWTHNDEEIVYTPHHAGPLALLAPAAEAVGGALGGGSLAEGIGGAMSGALSAGRAYQGVNGLERLLGLNQGQNGEQGGSAGPTGAPGQMPVQDYLSSTHTALDLPGGGTPGDSTKNQERPDEVDPKEKSDSPENLNDISGEDHGSDSPHHGDFDPSGSGVERFKMLFPLVKFYAESDEDGSEDPLLKALHEILEGELPGYLDHAQQHEGDAEGGVELHNQHDEGEDHLEKESEEPKESRVAGPMAQPAPSGNSIGLMPCAQCGAMVPPASPTCPQCGAQSGTGMHSGRTANPLAIVGPQSPEEEALQSANWPQSIAETCPNCGVFAKTALGGCAHCGADIHQYQAPHHGANHQGPHSPEQVAAVQQFLIDSGRVQEVPNVPIHPWEYADEMAQVSQTEQPPSQDVTQQPPMPAQEETPPDAGMPVPGMSMPPGQSSVTAADNLAPNCPKCDSHTTGAISDDGDCECHTCGNRWTVKDSLVEARVTARHWATADGRPLEAEQTYELHTPNIAIPDIVKVQQVKPDGIVLQFSGAHNMSFQKEITSKEADIEGYSFTSVRGLEAENTGPIDQPMQADYDKDVSYSGDGIGDNHQVTTNWNSVEKPKSIAQMILERRESSTLRGADNEPEINLEDHPERNWLVEDNLKTAGARYSPSEQRELIDEDGVARNSNKLDLTNTHYQRQTTVSDLEMVIGW